MGKNTLKKDQLTSYKYKKDKKMQTVNNACGKWDRFKYNKFIVWRDPHSGRKNPKI